MQYAAIGVEGLNLMVSYEYHKARRAPRDQWGQATEPDEAAWVEIIQIETECGGYDLTDITSDEFKAKVVEAVLENMADD